MIDYAGVGQERLTGQFTNSPKLQQLIRAILTPLTSIEIDADSLVLERWIDTAEGVQLDGVGNIVNELRNGRNDDDYRQAIRFRVFVNISRGTPADMLHGVKVLTNPTDTQYFEVYPATVLIFTNGFFIDSSISNAVHDLTPAAVDSRLLVSFADAPFRFSRLNPLGELFVNNGDDYLTANDSDIQVTDDTVSRTAETLGGVVPSELDVGIGYLDVGGPTLAVYDPNTANTLGHYNLTGVFNT